MKIRRSVSPIAMGGCAANDLHRKQWPDETLQECFQNFTDLTEKAMGVDPANITNRVIHQKSLQLWYKKINAKQVQKQ